MLHSALKIVLYIVMVCVAIDVALVVIAAVFYYAARWRKGQRVRATEKRS